MSVGVSVIVRGESSFRAMPVRAIGALKQGVRGQTWHWGGQTWWCGYGLVLSICVLVGRSVGRSVSSLAGLWKSVETSVMPCA